MSITLSTTASVSINSVAIESDANAAVSYVEMSFPDTIRAFVSYGNTAGQAFAPGATLPPVVIQANLKTGVWTSGNGLSGTISGAGLTNLQNTVLSLRNGIETFAVNQTIVAGTAVAWTTGSF